MAMQILRLLLALGLYAAFCSAAALAPVPVIRDAPTSTSSFVNGPCSHTAYPIPNAGFESGKIVPWVANSGLKLGYDVHLIQPGFDGSSWAVLLSIDTPGYSPSIYTENLPICAATSTVVAQTVTGYDGQTNVVKTQVEFPISYSLNWTEFSFEFDEYWHDSIGIMVSLVCELENQLSNGITLDEFRLDAVGSLEEVGCPHKPNTTGGDFENGKGDFFVVNAPHPTSFGIVSPGYQSEHAFQVNASNGGSSKVEIEAPVQTCLDFEYTFSFAYRFTGGNPTQSGCYWAVDLSNCNNGKQTDFLPDGSEDWQLGNFTCLMEYPEIPDYPPNNSSIANLLRLQLFCKVYSNPEPFSSEIDDVQVVLTS